MSHPAFQVDCIANWSDAKCDICSIESGGYTESQTAKTKTAAVFDRQKLTLLLTGKVIAPPLGQGQPCVGGKRCVGREKRALAGKNAALAGKNAALAGYRGEVSLQTSLGMVTLRDAPRLRAGQVFQLLLSPVGANQQTIGGFASGGALPLMGALAGQLGSAPEPQYFCSCAIGGGFARKSASRD